MREVTGGGARSIQDDRHERLAAGSMPRRKFLEVSATAAATAGVLGLPGAEASTVTTTAELAPIAAPAPVPLPASTPAPALIQSIAFLPSKVPLKTVTLSTFEPFLGDRFQARTMDGGCYEVTLVAIQAHDPRPGLASLGIREDPFSIFFEAQAGAPLSQGVYFLEHSRLSGLSLFMVPAGFRRPTDPILLQAVFG